MRMGVFFFYFLQGGFSREYHKIIIKYYYSRRWEYLKISISLRLPAKESHRDCLAGVFLDVCGICRYPGTAAMTKPVLFSGTEPLSVFYTLIF